MSKTKFKNPPVNEVLMGTVFVPIEAFRSEHIGLFWQKILDKYPESQQAANYGEPAPSKGEIYPAPRFWFITKTLDKLVQIQNNVFLCNWRKVDGKGTYPEYDEMKELFKENYSLFLEFLKERGFNEPDVIEQQFTYINHLHEKKEFDKVSEISTVVKSLGLPNTLSGQEVKHFDLNYNYDLPDSDKGLFKLKITTAMIKSTEQKIIVFENGARGRDPSSDVIYDWFDYAHENLVRNFEKLTDEEIQKTKWGKVS